MLGSVENGYPRGDYQHGEQDAFQLIATYNIYIALQAPSKKAGKKVAATQKKGGTSAGATKFVKVCDCNHSLY